MGRDSFRARHVSDQSHRLQNAVRPGQRRVCRLRRILHRHSITSRRIVPALATVIIFLSRFLLVLLYSARRSTDRDYDSEEAEDRSGWVTEWLIVHAWKACVPKG